MGLVARKEVVADSDGNSRCLASQRSKYHP